MSEILCNIHKLVGTNKIIIPYIRATDGWTTAGVSSTGTTSQVQLQLNGQTSITVGSYKRTDSGYSATSTRRYMINGIKSDGTSVSIVTRTSTHTTPITYDITGCVSLTISNQILGTMGSSAHYETMYMYNIVIE